MWNNLISKTITLGFECKLKSESIYTSYKFDVVKKKEKTIWIYKNEARHHFDKKKLSLI